ncbi:fumarylacetoacetate hydrolase family protein [Aquabacter sp. CN5-332]|uniref:fumarylacetoacetate hydrolase family protein n=1 Tax=Aquabacter sp. CN5-332 TaxID=3156608 RepID=UPI0032B57859
MTKLDIRAALAGTLPADADTATLVGRVWRPDVAGPSVVAVRPSGVFDVTARFPTVRDLCEEADPAAALRAAEGELLGPFDVILANTPPDTRDPGRPWLLAPIDLQAIKATGVTFIASLLERVIEERARGNPASAAAIRAELQKAVGDDLAALKPGSSEAARAKEVLISQGAWSQYLEVGIGPDAELFTKAPPMAAVGTGMDAGVHPKSTWNNPEPEVVLAVASTGRIVGATLGNDVNLRDVEGRSALLLGRAKDNNASCSLGPLLRLFDEGFSLDDVRRADLALTVQGEDGFELEDASSIALISRDPADIVSQMIGRHHQYPDGVVLFLGTMFTPVKDRDAPEQGFTHKVGDLVAIASPRLGRLVNRIRDTDACAPWTFGTGALMRNLAARGVLPTKAR